MSRLLRINRVTQKTASKETPKSMTEKRAALRTARRAILIAALLLGLSAPLASAAPVLDVQLENDPLADEVQSVTVRATGGQYRLNFGEGGPGISQTADIAATASAAEVAAALNAITNISDDGGSVAVSGGPGDALGTTPYMVTFSGGPLEMTDVAEMTVSPGTAPLSGGSKLVSIRTPYVGGVTLSDLRHDYTVKMKNTATTTVEVGASLGCNGAELQSFPDAPKSWNPGPGPTQYDFEWRRNGVLIPGETGQSYTITAIDEGASLQCMVKGTNQNASAKYASFPAAQVPPAPSPLPPIQAAVTGAPSRPTLTGTGTAMRTCGDPTNWTAGGTPVAFSYQWLRNGDEIAGATADTYTPSIAASGTGTWALGSKLVSVVSTTTGSFSVGQRINGTGIPTGTTIVAVAGSTLTISRETTAAATSSALLAGPDAGVALQCMVVGTTGTGEAPGGGGLVATSPNSSVVGVVPNPPTMGVSTAGTPDLLVNALTGPEVALELPGPGAGLVKAPGWSCGVSPGAGSSPAVANCESLWAIGAGEEGSATFSILLDRSGQTGAFPIEATVSGDGLAAPVSAVDTLAIGPARPFEITVLQTKVPDLEDNEETQAGAHPVEARGEFGVSRGRVLYDKGSPVNEALFSTHLAPIENSKRIKLHTPRGFVGNALAVPELCPSVAMTLTDPTQCPRESIVGGITIRFFGVGLTNAPIYSMKPEYGLPAQFAFPVKSVSGVYTFYPELRADDGYAISLISAPAPASPALLDINATLCGYGAKTNPTGQTSFQGCKQPGEADPDGAGPLTGANPTPLVTLPTRCAGEAPVTKVEIDSWQNPGEFKARSFEAPMGTGCDEVEFEPTAEIKPTSTQADSPTGLDVELTMPTNGLEGKDAEGNLDPEALAQANMKMTRVTFPEGMAINPSAGQGLGSCSEAQVKFGTNDPISCPDSSKIGTIEIDTPIIQETLTGAMYIGKQSEAPKGSLIGLHLVFESKKDGIIVKIPGEVRANPVTGQLVTVFDEILENPFSRVKISFNQGPRSNLLNPPRCGTYAVKAEMVPWTIADLDNPDPTEIVTQTTSFEVTEGPNGGPCPADALQPGFAAGTADPVAGKPSPFVMRLTRDDGTQRFSGLELSPPAGLSAHLRGVPYCPEEALASVSGAIETGQAQIDAPSCPAASQIGTAVAGAGGGPNPFYVNTGKVYLAGPYKGAPISIVVLTPAVAGPLDLGTVVVRNAVHVDPVSAQIRAVSDPIPTIWHGVLLDVRDIRVNIDRPGFTLNPTSCGEKAVNATVHGAGGLVANEPGSSAEVSSRFQVDGCAALAFKPRINLQLLGGVNRSAYQGVRAVIRPRAGDANISGAVVRFPNSAFVAQEHLNNICTRVQWAAEACPNSSIYGRAIAHSPLLDEPLKGTVHLRSSSNLLPDLVADLRGPAHQPIKVEVAIKTDSVKGALRNTVQTAPDAPVSFFRLQTFSGKKGLIVNSRNVCKGDNRARVTFNAHNGRRSVQSVPVRNARCAKQRKAQKRKALAKKRQAAAGKRAANRR